ncbi:MAG: hypothetical protein MJ211_10035 [Bacteroidales bacterium]|nr:hypothetical protein [Bacteroidales bacterium]
MGSKSSSSKSSSDYLIQPTTTTNLGTFGSTTTGATGSTWTPSDFQNKFTTNAQQQALNAQNAISDRAVSEEKVNAMNSKFNDSFNANYLAPAMQKGLLRGSTASDIYTMGQKQYAQDYQDLVDAEEQRQYQALANALANYTTIYDMATGTTGLSNAQNQAASNYYLAANNAKNTKNANTFSGLASSLGSLGGLGG